MIKMRLRDDSGIALVTAMLAMLVVASLAVAAFGLSAHTLNSSSTDRRRVQAINAAEAGIDQFLTYLAVAPTRLRCPGTGPDPLYPNDATPPLITGTLSTNPVASYTTVSASPNADVVYQKSITDPSPVLDCLHPELYPSTTATGARAVTIKSVGFAAGQHRTMEAYFGLAQNPGTPGGFTGGVYSDGQVNFGGGAQVSSDPNNAQSSGDVFSNGDLTLKGGGDIYGNAYVRPCPDASCQGVLNLQGTTVVHQGANSYSTLNISNNSKVLGDARSSQSSISGGGTIGGTAYYCTGSAPSGAGTSVKESPCPTNLPVARDWTTISNYFGSYPPSTTTWPSPTWQIVTYTDSVALGDACTQAYKFLTGATYLTGNYVLSLNTSQTQPCTMNVKNQVTLKGNLAIVSNYGAISVSANGSFYSATAANLYLEFGVSYTPPCTADSIDFNGGTISGSVSEVFYAPCQINFGSNSSAFNVNGQIYGGTVNFRGGANVTAAIVPLPGQEGTGYALNSRYKREISG